MNHLLEDNKLKIDALCQNHKVKTLYAFGSVLTPKFNENSDIDVLVKMEFKKGMYQNFCNLHRRLEEIFQKKVDLVDESMFEYKFKNPKVQKYKDEGYTVYFVGDLSLIHI